MRRTHSERGVNSLAQSSCIPRGGKPGGGCGERSSDGIVEKGTEIFIFTDYYVTERVFYRGMFESPDLCDLVLRLHGDAPLLNRASWTIRGTAIFARLDADLSGMWGPRGEYSQLPGDEFPVHGRQG
jgi:hypothetical protein